MKKLKFMNWKDYIIFFIVLGICDGILIYFNIIVGVIATLATLYLAYYQYRIMLDTEQKFEKYIENVNEQFDEITRRAIFTMPFSLVILDDRGKVKWYNTKFKNILSEEDKSYMNMDIEEIFKDLKLNTILSDEKYIEIFLKDKFYRFYINIFEDKKKGNNILLYGVDYNEEYWIKKSLNDNSLTIMNIVIDNYDELFSSVEDNQRPIVFAEIDRIINRFANKYEGYNIKYEQDSYTVIMSYENLEKVMESKFYILDEVREFEEGNTISATLSIGVGTKEKSVEETYRSSRACIDIALGRGGDQAVVKIDEHYEYFGGKKQSATKSTTVKARVMANGLAKLLEQGGDIFITGHKNPDMDSIGSCLGVMEIANTLDKNSYIVLDKVNPQIEKIYNLVLKEYPDENIKDKFISPEKARVLCEKDSTVVVLDHHSKSHSECPELLDISENIALIDHHRRGSDYIEDTVLTYLEPHASSTSELVTEILFFLKDKINIPKVIAEGLLAGITVDTKNFILQTGVRTFEAASILKRQGADSIVVRQLFRDSVETVRLKGEVVSNAEIYKDVIAIGVLLEKAESSILIAAQSADELLNMDNIKASFVLTEVNGKIHISGRSLGKISVQLILEKLGGGGHLTAAGVQLDCSIEEAKERLKEVVNEYLEEEKNESNINR